MNNIKYQNMLIDIHLLQR